MDFGRVITAMVTPFDDQLQIDWQQTEAIVNHLIDNKHTDSIIVCGTTGESPTVSAEEKLQLFERVVQYAAGRCKVIAGTGDNDTAYSVQMTQKAEKLGVDGFLLVTPYYNRPTQEGLYAHFKSVAEATSLPVMLYNVPGRTASHLSAETTIRLAKLPNVFATKEASGDFDEMTKIIEQTPDDFLLYSGDDPLTLPILSIGGYGVVSVASHLVGKQIKEMIAAYVDGQVKEAAQMHRSMHPLFKGLFICPNPVTIKYALKCYGLDVGGVRLPLTMPTAAEKQTIEKLVASYT